MPKEANWQEIKQLYICGKVDGEGKVVYPTNVDIAKQFNITPQALSSRISSEGWITEKNLYQDNLNKRKREKRIEALASEAADFDARILIVAKAGLVHIEKHFDNAKQVYKDTKKPMSLSNLERLSRCAERYQKVGRLALGENINSVQSNSESWIDLYDTLEGDI